jgi:hypothetical protein
VGKMTVASQLSVVGRMGAGQNIDPQTGSIGRSNWDESSFLIEASDRFYVVSENIPRTGGNISFALKKATRLIPGSELRYYVNKGTMKFNVDGKLKGFQIRRIVTKSKE